MNSLRFEYQAHDIGLFPGFDRFTRTLSSRQVLCEAHTWLEHEGDPSTYVYIVISGQMYSSVDLGNGKRQIVYLHKAGDIAGLGNLHCENIVCSLRSMNHCRLQPIRIDRLKLALRSNQSISEFLIHRFSEMQTLLISTLVAVAKMSGYQRMIWLILFFDNRAGQRSNDNEITVPLNQSEIGDLIGLTNVYVSRVLLQLCSEGLIKKRGKDIILVDRPKLRELITDIPVILH